MCDHIAALVAEIDAGDARAIVVEGRGPIFCAGADVAAVAGPDALTFLPRFEAMLEALAAARAPTIAAIQGAALGGGFQLASVCDLRVASTDAKIGIPSSRLGIVVNFENVERLVHLAGIARAKEILLAGRTFVGEEAAAAGLVTRAAEDPAAAAWELAEDIAAAAPLSVQGAKRAIGVVLERARSTRPTEVTAVDRLVEQAYRSADLQEGIAALGERRTPRFHGR